DAHRQGAAEGLGQLSVGAITADGGHEVAIELVDAARAHDIHREHLATVVDAERHHGDATDAARDGPRGESPLPVDLFEKVLGVTAKAGVCGERQAGTFAFAAGRRTGPLALLSVAPRWGRGGCPFAARALARRGAQATGVDEGAYGIGDLMGAVHGVVGP